MQKIWLRHIASSAEDRPLGKWNAAHWAPVPATRQLTPLIRFLNAKYNASLWKENLNQEFTQTVEESLERQSDFLQVSLWSSFIFLEGRKGRSHLQNTWRNASMRHLPQRNSQGTLLESGAKSSVLVCSVRQKSSYLSLGECFNQFPVADRNCIFGET